MTELEQYQETLEWFERTAQRLAATGRLQLACEVIHAGAGIAVMNHPGAFASHPFDALLDQVAATLPPPPAHERDADPRDVLHVLTHATAQGGHSRLASRWMERDRGRRHHLLITTPVGPTPPALRDAVAASGGREHSIADAGIDMLDRARRLRELAAAHDAVVLYPDPHDPLPALALSGHAGPPVLAADISDHCFALGRGAVDLHVCIRDHAVRTALEHRGIPAERLSVLPVPVELPAVLPDREQVRRELGLDDAELLVVTVGAGYKYDTTSGPHLLDLVEPVLAERPGARLLAAGPEPTGRWAVAQARLGGRIQALGVVEGLGLMVAADVVVESYPTGGSTASAEAAALGRPLVGFTPDPDEAALCAAGTVTDRPSTVAGFHARLAELLDDPAARAHAAMRIREDNAADLDAEAWRARLAELYARAAQLEPVRLGDLAAPPRGRSRASELAYDLHARAGKVIGDDKVGPVRARIELMERWPAARDHLLHSLGGYPYIATPFWRAVATPEATPEAIDAAVALLRLVARGGIARSCAVTLTPDAVPGALPLLESALEAGGDFELDVVPAEDPAVVLAAPGQLALA